MTGWLVFLAALSAGLVSGYTTRILARGTGVAALNKQPIWRALVGALSFLATLSVIAWGFVTLPWYGVVGAFLGISLLVVPLAFGRRGTPFFGFWYAAQPVTDMTTIGLAAYLWLGLN